MAEAGFSVESKNLEFILNYQEAMMKDVVPQIQDKINYLANNIVAHDIYIQHEEFLNRIVLDVK